MLLKILHEYIILIEIMKRFILFVLLIFTGVAVFAQSDELVMWSEVFDRAVTMAEQLSVITIVEKGNYPDAGEFYARALHRLIVEYPNIPASAVKERDDAETIAQKLASGLEDAGHSAASADLWQAVVYFSNPNVKANALIALGKTDTDKLFLPQVVQLVTGWNNRPQPDRETRDRVERTIRGAVIALENYKDPSGYLPVFFVSTGWYMAALRNQASAALPNIADDPTEFLLEVIRSPAYTYEVKNTALNASETSSSENEKKASVAVAALTEAWKVSTNMPLEQRILASTRKQSLRMIRRYKTQDRAVYQYIDKSLTQAWDREERLLSIETLKALASDEAARLLTDYLRELTERRRSGPFTREHEISARAIIPALGDIGDPSARPELFRVQQLDVWNYSDFRRLASEALGKLR
jgi:hypothetical protein